MVGESKEAREGRAEGREAEDQQGEREATHREKEEEGSCADAETAGLVPMSTGPIYVPAPASKRFLLHSVSSAHFIDQPLFVLCLCALALAHL